jgi:hypothetical protein
MSMLGIEKDDPIFYKKDDLGYYFEAKLWINADEEVVFIDAIDEGIYYLFKVLIYAGRV